MLEKGPAENEPRQKRHLSIKSKLKAPNQPLTPKTFTQRVQFSSRVEGRRNERKGSGNFLRGVVGSRDWIILRKFQIFLSIRIIKFGPPDICNWECGLEDLVNRMHNLFQFIWPEPNSLIPPKDFGSVEEDLGIYFGHPNWEVSGEFSWEWGLLQVSQWGCGIGCNEKLIN